MDTEYKLAFSWIFAYLVVIFFITWIRRRYKEEFKTIFAQAQEDDIVYAVSKMKRNFLDHWIGADFNKRAIFAAVSDRRSIVVFSYTGLPIALLCLPEKFDAFRVSEDALYAYYVSGETAYLLDDILWFDSDVPLELPEPQKEHIRLKCTNFRLVASTPYRKRHFRYEPDWMTVVVFLLIALWQILFWSFMIVARFFS